MKKVLLIEDDVVLRENTAELLNLSGYKVITASNGKIGIEIAKNKLPDIIISDIMMPELDGFGVLDALAKSERTKFIPFIFLSARTERQDIRKGMNLGADDYIAKPFSEDELISAIESRLAKITILKDIINNQTADVANNHKSELNTLKDLKHFFNDNGHVFACPSEEIIYREGQNCNSIYLVNKGVVRCYKLDKQGKELTTALYKKNDLFGYTSFMENGPSKETATVIKDAELVCISKSELRKILDSNNQVSLELIQLLSEDLTGIKDQLLQMAYSSVYRKTAMTILKFAEKMNRKAEDPIKISRSDLASVAGIATETLIRTLAVFKKQGLIAIEGRNIKILDQQKLYHVV